jgi:hypothetical protein
LHAHENADPETKQALYRKCPPLFLGRVSQVDISQAYLSAPM